MTEERALTEEREMSVEVVIDETLDKKLLLKEAIKDSKKSLLGLSAVDSFLVALDYFVTCTSTLYHPMAIVINVITFYLMGTSFLLARDIIKSNYGRLMNEYENSFV